MPTGYGIGYGSIGPNPWASANAAQYLGPGAQFQTLAGAPGSAGQYWSDIRPPGTPQTRVTPSQRNLITAIEDLTPRQSKSLIGALGPKWVHGSLGVPTTTPQYGLKPPPKGTYQQPRNPVVPAGDAAPYKGTEAPIAAPSKGGTLRIGGLSDWRAKQPTPNVQRITVPQDATQTRQQVKGGRKQIKLPEPEAIAAIGGAGLLLILL